MERSSQKLITDIERRRLPCGLGSPPFLDSAVLAGTSGLLERDLVGETSAAGAASVGGVMARAFDEPV
jgi:hypothetical protein